jgi:sugar lactone lactonase YvrE
MLIAPATAKLVVVSSGDTRILEYDEADGSFVGAFVTPVTTGFAFPGGLSIHPSSGDVYVSSTATGEIFAYDLTTGLVAPPAVATGLLSPTSLVFDSTGANLYFVADVPNGPDTDAAIRRLQLPGGAVSTLATDAVASFSALTLEGSNLYVCDSFAGTVVRYSTSGGSGTTVVSGLSSPSGVLLLSPTAMLIADTGTDRVLEYHESGGSWSFDREVLTAAAGVDGPTGLALAPDGRLSVSGAISDDVVAIDLATLVVSPLVAPSELGVPGDLEWDGGTLLVTSRSANAVPFFDSAGTPTGLVARGLTAPPDRGIEVLPNGNLVAASTGANRLSEFDPQAGGLVRALPNACPSSFTSPFDVAANASGDLYVSCPFSDGVRRFDVNDISVPFVALGSGGLGAPRGLVFGPNGNLFVASASGEVLEYQAGTGNFVGAFVDTTGNGGGAIDPYGLVFHGSGLFVVSNFPNEVREFDTTTGAFVQVFVSAGSGGLSDPVGLTFGPDGDLYVTSRGDDSIKRYDGATGAFVSSFVPSASGGLDDPFDLAFLGSPPPAVPSASLGAHGLLVLAVGLLGAGAVRSWPAASPTRRRGRTL